MTVNPEVLVTLPLILITINAVVICFIFPCALPDASWTLGEGNSEGATRSGIRTTNVEKG